jgi:hypothetical protein
VAEVRAGVVGEEHVDEAKLVAWSAGLREGRRCGVDGEAHGECDSGASEAHHGGAARREDEATLGQRWCTRTAAGGAGDAATCCRPSVHREVGMVAAKWGEAVRRSKQTWL